MYTGISSPSRWVLPAALAEQAARQPDARWITTVEGEDTTFGQAWHDAQGCAGWFAALGVKRGQNVAVMMGNHLDFVRVWLGLGALGAVAVLLNPELRGAFLEHQLRNCDAELAVVDAALLATVEAVAGAVPGLQRVAVTGPPPAPAAAEGALRLRLLPFDAWRDAVPYTGPLPAAKDLACIMYTSGTSGPAKGVLMPHAHCTLYGVGMVRCVQLTAADRYYITLPLFHANGLLMQLAATLLVGCEAVVRARFSASEWLVDLRRCRATVTNLLGATAAFALSQPETAVDRDHALRAVLAAPNLPPHEAEFRRRFGVADVISGYGMTEVNIPIHGRMGQSRPGAAGWVDADWFDLIVVDPETDEELPRGQTGEILVRPKIPFAFMQGYHGMPEQTVQAWRNLWFHSGDAAVMDEDGLVTFVDRLKDSIRRRGENISATEVEAVVMKLAGVAEVAAYAVPATVAGGEDEVMLAVVLAGASRADLTPREIARFAAAGLPRFAAPRYVQIVAELPKTSTGKVQRAVLRRGGSGQAWDREDAS